MSMSHKAFALDWVGFSADLRPIFESGDLNELREFIADFEDELKPPYDGFELDEDDFQSLADFALTLYYDPEDDIGVAEEFLALEPHHALLLGQAIGNFDPGKQGSYFQSADDVRRNLERAPEGAIRRMLEGARANPKAGIYVTF